MMGKICNYKKEKMMKKKKKKVKEIIKIKIYNEIQTITQFFCSCFTLDTYFYFFLSPCNSRRP